MKRNITKQIRKAVEAQASRSAWNKGVTVYALELLDGLQEAVDGGWFDLEDIHSPRLVERALLNGACDWNEYSWGGCSLIYDSAIAKRLCTASELKKTKNGERKPNSNEEWLDTQARALFQASIRIIEAIKEIEA